MTTKTTSSAPPATKTTTTKPASGVTFELTLNGDSFAASQVAAGQIEATLLLRVNESAALPLTFVNGQQFDLEIHDASGALVNQWSRGKVFSDLAQTVQVAGERKWTGSLPVPVLAHPPISGPIDPMPITTDHVTSGQPVSGAPIPRPPEPIGGGVDLTPVVYTLTGYLTTGGASAAVHPYGATVAFTVHPQPVLEMTAPQA
jgi:hypothetical protein